jgi:hypothetical protein
MGRLTFSSPCIAVSDWNILPNLKILCRGTSGAYSRYVVADVFEAIRELGDKLIAVKQNSLFERRPTLQTKLKCLGLLSESCVNGSLDHDFEDEDHSCPKCE